MRKGLLAPHNRNVMVNGKICSYAIKSRMALHDLFIHWASCQIRKLRVAHAPGMPVTFSPRLISDPDMHHGTCVRHVTRCLPGSLTSGFLWSRWRRKCSRHSRNPQFTYLTRGLLHDTFIQCSTRDKFIRYHNDPFHLRMLWTIS